MQKSDCEERGSNGDMQDNSSHDAASKRLLRGGGMGLAGHYFGYWLRGCVTMLMLVMPACLTASITEANAPKGTFSSART
jgi:hypothetical protein